MRSVAGEVPEAGLAAAGATICVAAGMDAAFDVTAAADSADAVIVAAPPRQPPARPPRMLPAPPVAYQASARQ